jgi:acyl-CoA thioester hydrolase
MNAKAPFEYEFTVTDDLLDGYNHVNNARYLDLYERARWEILDKSGLGRETVHKQRIGPVIIEVSVRFSLELLPGERIKIFTSSKRKNELVLLFEQKMVTSQGKIASKALFTTALFDLETRKMVRPDEVWIKAMGLD